MKRSVVPLVLTALLLSACSTGDDASSSSAGGEAASSAVADAAQESQALAPTGPDADPAGAPALGRADLTGSALVRTAELDVRVDDVRAAADEAGRLAREAGGAVAAERTRAGDDGAAGAELSLQVAPERFDAVLDALAGLGDEQRRAVSSEEVGDTLVDLESRLSTQRASVARVQALLAEAEDLGEVVQVEAELTRRTADLESLQARLAALQGSVQRATVVLRLDQGEASVAAGTPGGFLDGLAGGWSALLAALAVLATVAGAALPFLPLLLAGWLVLRRRRPARGASPA